MHKFTNDQRKFIEDNANGLSNQKITDLVNEKFNLALTVQQVKGFKHNNKISSGLTGYFPKGHVSSNPIKKGQRLSQKTEFKKGEKSWNYMPVGSERINTDGYKDIKIADPNKWRAKHILLWEQHNGPMPKGYKLIFLDGNKLNISLDNIELVSNAEMLNLNRLNLIKNDSELTKTGILLTKVILKTNKRRNTNEK